MQAEPYEYVFDLPSTALVVIDMQRDFVEPGGFGAALGNDVSPLQAVIAPCRRMLDAAREIGAVALARMDDHHLAGTGGVEHAPARPDHVLQRRDVVAERLAEPTRLDEVALHVDDDQRRRAWIELELVRFSGHRGHVPTSQVLAVAGAFDSFVPSAKHVAPNIA